MDKKWVNILLKIEYIFLFVLGVFCFFHFGGKWYFFLLFILLPDISMIGYLINNKIGAIIYNVFHIYAGAILLIGLGFFLNNEISILSGFIWFSHISIDRIFNYGLKYQNFHTTHLN